MFIARVSRGRTIREFVIGVLLVPVGFTFIWMTVFGNTAIWLDMGIAGGEIAKAVSADSSTAIFRMLEFLPLTKLLSGLAILLVITFFVTSSDSGSLVIDIITSGGDDDPPTWQRVFWALTEGIVAAVLLLAGGLGALQTASIAAALPFTIVMMVVCVGLFKALRLESHRMTSAKSHYNVQIRGASVSWQDRLRTVASLPKRDRAINFIQEVAQPALTQVCDELCAQGYAAEIESADNEVTLKVQYSGQKDFVYGVALKRYTTPDFIKTGRKTYYRAEVRLSEGAQHYDVMGYTQDQLIADLVVHYEKHLYYLELAHN
jgi:choline/glycine/proline betaine transport protein